MKLADIGPLIWMIIFVVVALAKGWSKLQRPVDDDSSKTEETPAVARPKPPQRPQPRLQLRPAVPVPRAYSVPPQQRTLPRIPVRAGAPSMPGGRKVSSDEIRRFVEQLSGKAQAPPPPPPPVARAPMRKAEPPPAPPPEPETSEPLDKQAVAMAPVSQSPSRSSQWMEALRDRNNIRNIVIAAEIIGPPRAESI